MISITTFICGLLTLLFGVVSVYLVPWLKAKLGEVKVGAIAYWVGVFVSAAEQLLKGEPGQEKLRWVEAQLAAMGFALDTDAVRALIEAQVRKLKAETVALETAISNVSTISEEVAEWQKEAPPEDPGNPES